MNVPIGLGDFAPASNFNQPPVVNQVVAGYNAWAAQQAAAAAKAAKGISGMDGLGCGCSVPQMVNYTAAMESANTPGAQQGRDVVYRDVGLSGMGDWQPAFFTVPQNPIAGNAIGRALAGLNGIDVTSLANFETSLTTGTSFGLPNLLVVGGAAVLLFMLTKGKGHGR